MRTLTAPDLSVTITEDEARHAFEIYHLVDWDGMEARIPEGARDTNGNPVDRNNHNLKVVMMGAAAVDHRVGKEAAVDEALRLMRNPMFEAMIAMMIDAFEKTMRPNE